MLIFRYNLKLRKMNIDLTKPVKFKYPESGEENMIFKVENYNEATNRIYIEWINSNMTINPSFLVSVNDVVNI